MIFDDLKKENMVALKEKNRNLRAVLEVVINKCMLKKVELGHDLEDKDTLAIIQKTIKELEEEKLSFVSANRLEEVENLTTQISYLDKYLPKQLSDEEIKNIILALPDHSIPVVMKHFKENYAGQVDMKKVSQIVKEI